jgi:D-alanine--D-alanine ligase
MTTLRVVVLMGGPSSEHEVSLKTGQAMLDNLNRDTYEVIPVQITKSGQWAFGEDKYLSLAEGLAELQQRQVDVVLIGLHGTFGEDGVIQALFDLHGITYTGSPAAASLLGMNKTVSNALYESAHLPLPLSRTFGEDEIDDIHHVVATEFKLPVVVKPEAQGSSRGVHIVKTTHDLLPAAQDALGFGGPIMVQEFIQGREVSCGVLESADGSLRALPPTEVQPLVSEFFDFQAKYSPNGARETTPPENMDPAIIQAIQSQAMKAHQLLGCRGYSRTDMIVRDDVAYLIETNTLPGMTATSFLPQQAHAAGMSFGELLDGIIQRAVAAKSV